MAKQGKIIRNGIVYSGSGGCDIEYLTQAEYDALPDSKLTNGVEYRITDSNPPTPTAKDMGYDNSESGIDAENVQDAIDSVNESVSTLNESLSNLNTEVNDIKNIGYLNSVFTTDAAGNVYLGNFTGIIGISTDSNNTYIKWFKNSIGMWYANITYADFITPYQGTFRLFICYVK